MAKRGGWLSHEVLTIVVAGPAAADVSNVTSTAVQVGPSDSVRFVAALGALTPGQQTKLKVQWSDDNAVWADVPGSETAGALDADSNKLLISDVYPVLHKWYRAILERGSASAASNLILCELCGPMKQPVIQDASVSQIQTALAYP